MDIFSGQKKGSDENYDDATYGVKVERSNKKWLIVMVIVSLIPVLVLVAICLWKLSEAVQVQRDAKDGERTVKNFAKLSGMINYLQTERGYAANFIRRRGVEFVPGLFELISNRTDDAAKQVTWPRKVLIPEYINTKEKFLNILKEERRKVKTLQPTIDQVLQSYTRIIYDVISGSEKSIVVPDRGDAWNVVVASGLILRAADPAAVQFSMARNFFYKCTYTDQDITRFLQEDGMRQVMLESAFEIYPPIKENYDQRLAEQPSSDDLRELIPNKAEFEKQCEEYPEAERFLITFEWTNSYFAVYNLMLELIDDVTRDVASKMEDVGNQAENNVIIYVIVLLLVVVLSLIILHLQTHRTSEIVHNLVVYTKRFAAANSRVREEKSRGDSLLHQMLPVSIAQELIAGRQVQPKLFYSTTICYIDIAGYVALISQLQSSQVVKLLNLLYSMFDSTADTHGVCIYKVEQHNDVYSAMSGAPDASPNHPQEIANFLLEILQRLRQFEDPGLPGVRIHVRMGAHTGPVAAGVSGHKTPRYTVFGESVKMAERMCRSSEVDRILISRAMRDELVKYNRYRITERGQIQVYGIGKVIAYYLDGY